MNISELIAQLERVKSEHGDLPVYMYDDDSHSSAERISIFKLKSGDEMWDRFFGESDLIAAGFSEILMIE